MARYLRQNTARTITVGPFFDVTDGITPEVSLTVTGCHLTLMVDNEGTPTLALDADATASGGNNDMVHVTNDDAGYYTLELTQANTNYVGGATLTIIDTDVHLPVFHEFTILPANVYDSLIVGTDLLDVNTAQWLGTACATPTTAGVPEVDITHIAGAAVSATTAQLGVNVVQVSGDGTAADNLEAACDGTTYNIGGGAVVAASVTAMVSANVTQISGDSGAADNLEAACDGNTYNVGGGAIVAASVSGAVGSVTGAVGSVAANGITAASIATDAIDADALAADALAEINTQVDTALSDINLDHLVGTASGIPAIPAGTWLDIIMDDGTATYDRTTDSLQALRDGAATVAAVADGVWDEARSGHTTAGSFGEGVASVQGAVTGAVASVTGNVGGSVASVATGGIAAASFAAGAIDAAAIATGAIDADAIASNAITAAKIASDAIAAAKIADGAITSAKFAAGAIDATVLANGAIDNATFAADVGTTAYATNNIALACDKALLNTVPPATIADAVWDEASTGHTDAGKAGAQMWTDVDAILADTGTDGVIVASIANNAITANAIAQNAIDADSLATDAGTEIATAVRDLAIAGAAENSVGAAIASILDDTGTAGVVVASLAADSITNSALHANAVAEIADGVWDEATSGHVTAGSFGQRLQALRTGTAQAGADGSITLDASASAVADFYKNALIAISGGTGVGQCRTCSAYDGDTKVASITPNWGTNPSSDSVFYIIPTGAISGATAPTAADVADAVWDEAASGHATSGTFGQRLQSIRTGTAQAGAAGTITLDAGASAVTDFYKNALIFLTEGTGASQCRTISSYAGDTKVANITPNWATTPDTDSVFVVIPMGAIAGTTAPSAEDVADAVWNEALSGHTDPGSASKALSDVLADTGTDGVLVSSGTGTGQIALSSGTVTTGAISNNAITANAIAQNAIDADSLAADAATEIAVACRDVAISGAAASSVGAAIASVLDDTGTAGVIVASIANDAITANALNANAATEIATACRDIAIAGAAGSSVGAAVASILADTGTDGVVVASINNDAITAASIQADAIGASELAAGAATEIATAVRDIAIAGAAANSVGAAVASILDDTGTAGVHVATIANNAITAASINTGAIDADALAADAVDEILDEVVEGTTTFRQALRLMLATLAGKCSGAGTATITFRDIADSKDRVIATVDASGNRASVTRDVT